VAVDTLLLIPVSVPKPLLSWTTEGDHHLLKPFYFLKHWLLSSLPFLFSYAKMSEENDNLDGGHGPFNLLDEFLAQDEIVDDVVHAATKVLQSTIEGLAAEASDHRSNPRKYINRPREEAHQQLVNDYFSENPLYPSNMFRRRFRMNRPLFERT
jgi:hypothetical protein